MARIPATARNSPPGLAPDNPQITALLFDHTTNLLWCGDSAGNSSSFTPAPAEPSAFGHTPVQLFRYTKFHALASATPVIQHLNHQRGILSLLNSSICFNSRRGLYNTLIDESAVGDVLPLFRNLTCMTLAYSTSNDLIVGGNNSLLSVDLQKPNLSTQFRHEGDVLFINYSSKLLTLGKSTGQLEIFDPVANQSVKLFSGHNGLLSDLDVKGNYAATCGYSVRNRRFGASSAPVEYMVDPLVNIYDLRMMRALSPVPFSAGASFVKFHPKLPNIIIIASTTGQIQFVDMYDQLEVHLYQADLVGTPAASNSVAVPPASYLSNLDISDNGEFLCFSDGYPNLHLWALSSNSAPNFVNFPAALDRPDVSSLPPSANPIGLDDDVALNVIGMPFYKEFLLSNYPTDMIFTKELLKLPQKIDTLLLELSHTLPGKVLPYDKSVYGPRNVLAKYESLKVNTKQKPGNKSAKQSLIPKFISERSQASSPGPSTPTHKHAEMDSPSLFGTPTFSDFNDHEINSLLADINSQVETIFQYKSLVGNRVPSSYTKLEIHYSKFGVDDFDFDFYNQSNGLYAGLENHLDNSYANPLLQAYRFIPIFYNIVTQSLLKEWLPNSSETIIDEDCPQGSSILNELGYLFDMMHNAGSRNVSIANFSLNLSDNKLAQMHELIVRDDGKSLDAKQLQNLIITFNKFLVESVVNDYGSQFRLNVQDLTAMHYELEFYTASGEFLDKKYGNQATLDLVTPPNNVLNKVNVLVNQNRYNSSHAAKKNHTLLTYLEYSLNQTKMIPASQKTPYPVEIKQSVLKLGPVLSINLPFTENEFQIIKACKKWLVPEFYTTLNNNKKLAFKPVVTQLSQRVEKYELQAYVCEISHGLAATTGVHNLISYVKIRSPALGKDQWFLFNDFLVMPIPEEEVFNLSPSWKKPVILIYHNCEDPRNQQYQYFEESAFRRLTGLDTSILYRDHFACGIREGYRKDYELLTQEEAPMCGSLVAIDAEFVSLRPEVVEVSYTGVRNLIRPTALSLARISALRGDEGEKHGIPFIDDYIVHTKPIYDNLTTFSGIEAGDLDPKKSTKTLVTLQTAYRRLWLLLNMGCIFVGHGLKSDFRCINLQVPRAQIRDTIEFYYLPDFRRKLSLKFLAYIVLKEAVQTSNHDSIEDAMTALRLYEKFLELQLVGEFENELNRIYSEGQQLRFRVPDC